MCFDSLPKKVCTTGSPYSFEIGPYRIVHYKWLFQSFKYKQKSNWRAYRDSFNVAGKDKYFDTVDEAIQACREDYEKRRQNNGRV